MAGTKLKGRFIQGNTKPFFRVQLRRVEDDTVIDLAGAEVHFFFRHNDEPSTPKVDGVLCTIVDAGEGKVEYRWAANDLDTPGTYEADFRVTDSGGKVQSNLIENVVVRRRLDP